MSRYCYFTILKCGLHIFVQMYFCGQCAQCCGVLAGLSLQIIVLKLDE